MLILRNESEIHRITNPAIRQLMALRFLQLNATDDPDAPDAGHVEFIVVEAGDPVPEIEQAAGFPILTSLIDDLPFEHPDFYPCTEILEEHRNEHTSIFEMVFISNNDGAATAIFVPDEEGIAPDLLAMCRSFATPAVSAP